MADTLTMLTTKVQYNNFEMGEFIEEEKRTYDDTVELIEKFSWNKQRENIQISLTNPSITIENEEGNFLKLAVYYNLKFVLHYCDREDHLYTKALIRCQDALPYIKAFFSAGEFNLSDFRKENTWPKKNRIHFITQDFHYQVTPKSARIYFLRKTVFALYIVLITICLLIALIRQDPKDQFFKILILFVMILTVLPSFSLFVNYYLFAKGKLLIMSAGNDTFYFGDKDNPVKYDKKDIELVKFFNQNSRSITNVFALTVIVFKDGREIHIPNIFVDEINLLAKLRSYPVKYKYTYEFIPLSATT